MTWCITTSTSLTKVSVTFLTEQDTSLDGYCNDVYHVFPIAHLER